MDAWWAGITTLEKVYWFFAVPFSLVFIIQLIMAILGFDSEQDLSEVADDMDGDAGDDSIDTGLRLFSVRNTIIFFTIFGWTGIASIRSGINDAGSIFLSFAAGFVMMYAYAKLFNVIMKLTESGTMDIQNALNHTGTVYLKIPPKREGTGKINMEIQGAMREIDAVTDGDEIPTGESVIVSEILENQTLLVKKYLKE